MKRIIIILLLFVGGGAKSQSITEKMGAVSTNFKITSASLELNVTDQILIKRNTSSYNQSHQEYANHERYYFQFICKDSLTTVSRAAIKANAIDKQVLTFYPEGYFVKLLDENNYVIYEFTRERGGTFNRIYNLGKGGYSVHSFYMSGFPLILLDKVKQIDVQIIN